ncbi:KN motif and ankyrin repeat domain-containing protein 2-like [Centruroides vittatus]|uniref:KN motif and ankyrin repeat domain-containing protein 2-like n=1 Tax=Centruroides vittatus TaxID=120091 RepID=UPI00350EE0FE
MAAKKKDDNSIKTVTIREGFIEEERGVGTIENLIFGNQNAKPALPQSTIRGGAQCNCCPYGYHIDLDFVTYCEELYNGTYHHNAKHHLCKEHHKHRKSPEISMGIRSHLANRFRNKTGDSSLLKLDNSLNYNEKWKAYQTCHSHDSHKSPLTPLKIGISIDTTDAHLSNIRLSPQSQNDGPSLTPPFTTSHSQSGSNTSLSSTSTEFNTHFHHSNNSSKCTCGSQQIADTMAALNSASVIQSGLPPGYVGINTNVLSTIRSQVATSLQRMKELEEQAKAVPVLQVKLSVLNEEKRLLLLQLKNKSRNLEQKSINKEENDVKGNDDNSLSYAATLPRFRKRTLSGTSLGRSEVPMYSSTGHLTYSLDEPLEKHNVINLKDFHSHKRIYDSIEKFVNSDNDSICSVKELRNVGTSCAVLTRDIGVGHIAERQRSVGIGDEKISTNPNKMCIKCGTSTIRSDILLDSLSSSEFAGSESDGEGNKFLQKRTLSKQIKTLKTEDKAVLTDPIAETSKGLKLTCNKGEQISILPFPLPCTKCEEKAAIKYKSIGTNPKLIDTSFKSSGVNTDRVILKHSNVSTDNPKLLTVGSITDKILSESVDTETELSSIDIDALLLLQQKRKQMKDKGTGVPRPLLANVRIQTISNTKDSATSINIETQPIGIQVNIPVKSPEEIKQESSQTLPSRFQKHSFEEKKIINKSVQTDNIQTIDASCGSCSIHDTFCNRCELRQMETIGVGDQSLYDVLCDRCQNIKLTDVAVGEEKFPVFHSIGINTVETLDRTVSSSDSGIHVCDKCNAKIKLVAKDLVDKNMDNVLHSAFSHSYKEDNIIKTKSFVKINTETVQKITSNQKIEIKENNVTEKELTSEHSPCEADLSDSSSESPDEKSYNGILTRIINRHKPEHLAQQERNEAVMFESYEITPRKKTELSKEMKESCKVLNESLVSPQKGTELASNMEVIQKEWFQISSCKDSDPHVVEDYLDAFEEISKHLLHRIVNLTDANGNTAMHYAVSHGNFDVVSVLLDSKVCDANIQNKAGYTAVMLISLAEIRNEAHKQVVRRLFQINDINLKASQNGQTALMLAASQGRVEAVKLLLECGAEINMQDKDGSTALMCAAEHGHGDVVHLLLSIPDCDPSLTDNDGSSALSIAMDAGHRDVALMIYANMNFSRGSSPYSSLRTRRSRTVSSSRSSLPTKGSPSTPPPSPRPRRNSSNSSTF